ncbi:MOSC domain-containing protein (plasmid) [Haloferax mediterranei ATCC 33500]|uniref:MOSC domain protein n=1 Tax=Haloferax mediterranei (strain ATCC 33500 / DSM 1411 / JCM 8866 / NBRC 14739 / NCIMB 2177 / R-4) TaxID=523841 RepID=I3RBH5_HALMT|nr:MOSC domain-containing protein [Haloferax mediterranei]AFK21585.1 MOSC domain protein [Haloferax mediterranei ATCC 33500]AHZ24368.1 sulfurase [Haloferax mediterranei ATCC 33500]ELZ97105.1 MOSC domain-containing protein [Haloferax mediterranei ATCC 33500]MDX5990151.1 MOSC domain-containing protein [Haloferax mediterranei ATCC 33500]QCQ76773.1 MOSC domain-containing protein [Haloferax mediterranei ATCC 33500]
MTVAHIRSIQVGTPETYGTEGATDPMDRPWETAFYKQPVDGELFLGETNLDGDRQANLRHHGGPEKAVCVYPGEHYPYWEEKLEVDLGPAAFGENFTIEGFTEREACIGDIYEVGEATVQITQPRSPCWKLARRWRVKDLAVQVEQTGYTGWYLRVLETGTVAPGESIRLVDRPNPDWSVARATKVRYRMSDDRELAGELADVEELGKSWTKRLERRAETGAHPDSNPRVIGPNESIGADDEGQ